MGNVLITGANRGIGLAFARVYHDRGERVVATARRPDEAHELRELGVRIESLDQDDDASVSALAGRLSDTAVDLLLLNAGILASDRLDDLDLDSVARQLSTNAVGPLRVVRALRPHLERSASPKVVALSSVMGSIGSNREGGYYGYRASKAALNAIARSLAADLPFPVTLVHPGYVRTRMTGEQGEITPEEAAASLSELIDRIDDSMSGRFYDRHGQELPW